MIQSINNKGKRYARNRIDRKAVAQYGHQAFE